MEISSITLVISLALALVGWIRSPSGTLKSFLKMEPGIFRSRVWLLSLAAVVVSKIVLVALSKTFFGIDGRGQEELERWMAMGPLGIVFIFTYGALAMPILEELIYRGYATNAFGPPADRSHYLLMAIITSGLFAASHPSGTIADKIASGLIYSLLRFRLQSLVGSIFIHIMVNAFAFTWILILVARKGG